MSADKPRKPKPKPRPKPRPRPRTDQVSATKDPDAKLPDEDVNVAEAVEAVPAEDAPSGKPATPAKSTGAAKPTPAVAKVKAKAKVKATSKTKAPANAPAIPSQSPTAQVAHVASVAPAGPDMEGDEEFEDDVDEGGSGSFLLFTAVPSWLTSTVVHVIVLLVLALFTLPPITRPKQNELVLGDNNDTIESLEEFQDQELDTPELDASDPISDLIAETELVTDEPIVTDAMDLSAAAIKMDLDPVGLPTMNSNELGSLVGVASGDALSGRGQSSRARMIREGGGSPGSEAAVANALKWLAAHQMPDGGWRIDHGKCPQCQGRCPDAGTKKPCRFGATGLALLPFLGSGQTHQVGEYKQVIKAGLDFLVRNMKATGPKSAACIDEGNYYSHGLCTIVMCEAYAMTKDKTLRDPAQALINETVLAQDPIGGGWRYERGQPGDTSAVGWQLMALKSAHMAYLSVPAKSVKGAAHFLDSVQQFEGAGYGYTEPGENFRRATSSVGLLCRMYLGWKKDHPALMEGVRRLSEKGPSEDDIYMNYYATQIMRHYGGPEWEKWNAKMREQLVNTQEKTDKGHRAGSWVFHKGHANEAGGRLYCTSLATMILEVYYRHLPLYKDEVSEDEFPL